MSGALRRTVTLVLGILSLARLGLEPANATAPNADSAQCEQLLEPPVPSTEPHQLAAATPIPFAPQRPGNPEDGYRALVSKGWVGCGVPKRYYDLLKAIVPKRWQPMFETLPGRPPGQEDLPYFLNRFTNKEGIEVLTPNCLICHAGRINGELVVGLGNADGRYQPFDPQINMLARLLRWGSWLDVLSSARRAEMGKVGDRVMAVAPYIQVPVVGSNPANNMAWALVVHHDEKTLVWSEAPTLPLPPRDAPPADVPPWWRMSKKYAMFASGAGRGDHTGLMAINATLCVDTVADFEAFYAYFNDIRAFVASIRPPRYPYPIDCERAAAGRQLFDRRCAGCHGTYERGGTYPNLLLPLDVIGTDRALADYHVLTSAPAAAWLNNSVFTVHGARYAPSPGYVAPPLDGIWATAPFLHNGSVPTLAALLDSSTRPKYWTRSYGSHDYDSREYDADAVGWKFERLEHGQADVKDAAARRKIVDTTLPGFGNGGHTFGDSLTPEDRAAVLEYLKTL